MRIRTLFRSITTTAIALVLIPSFAQSTQPFGLDLHGHPIRQLAGPGTRIVVLIFAASDCPISNRYVPEIARLNQEFSGKGIKFWWVFPNATDSAAVVSRHNRDFSIRENTVLDPHQSLVALAQATVTPEAAVFLVQNGSMRELYNGRVDDRYLSIGQERPQPQRHELEDAIAAALDGKPIPQPGGPPVGCSIVFLQK